MQKREGAWDLPEQGTEPCHAALFVFLFVLFQIIIRLKVPSHF